MTVAELNVLVVAELNVLVSVALLTALPLWSFLVSIIRDPVWMSTQHRLRFERLHWDNFDERQEP